MKSWIPLPRVEGQCSRQAHADLPEGSYERELGRDGFYGPATHMIHSHPPTGWIRWEGPLRPRAFDLVRLEISADSPWQARELLGNDHMRLRIWRSASAMDHLVRNGDAREAVVNAVSEPENSAESNSSTTISASQSSSSQFIVAAPSPSCRQRRRQKGLELAPIDFAAEEGLADATRQHEGEAAVAHLLVLAHVPDQAR